MTPAAGFIAVRLLHYLAVSILFGTGLFPLYAIGRPAEASYRLLAWLPTCLRGAALLAVASGVLWLVLSPAAPAVWQSHAGRIWIARLALAATLTAVLFLPLTRARIYTALAGAALLTASLAATGHAGAGEAGVSAMAHIVADALHLLASAIWIGALVAFAAMLTSSRRNGLRSDTDVLRVALVRFSEAGGIVVAVILLSAFMNPNVLASFSTRYGVILLIKIALFGAMLLLAAANRFWLTPMLAAALDAGRDVEPPMRALRASVLAETMLAILVLGAVAWLGMLAAPSATPLESGPF